MRRAACALVALAALSGCGLFASPPPDTAARDAHLAEVKACELYAKLPAEKHSDLADRICRQIQLECTAPGAAGAPGSL